MLDLPGCLNGGPDVEKPWELSWNIALKQVIGVDRQSFARALVHVLGYGSVVFWVSTHFGVGFKGKPNVVAPFWGVP